MKKMILTFLLLCLYIIPRVEAYDAWVEGKVGYCYPTDHKFRKIYHDEAVYGAEVNIPFCEKFTLWTSADYYESSGHSIGFHNHTCIRLIPVGLGLKYFIPLNCISRCFDNANFYVGAGVQYVFLDIHDHSNCAIQHVRKNGFGYVAKTGIIFDLACNWFLDIFTDYKDKTFNFNDTHHGRVIHTNAFVSSISAGVGIGYKFGCNECDRKCN